VPIAGIEEQFRGLAAGRELATRVEIALLSPLVALRDVNLHGYVLRPGIAKLGRWQAGMKEQGAPGAGARLGQLLRRHHTQREPGMDDLAGQPIGGTQTPLEDGVEADLPGIANPVGELVEGLAVVEVGDMHDVSGSTELIGEGLNARRQAMCMVEKQKLSHSRSLAAALPLALPCFSSSGRFALPGGRD
jgi:hypothetical protein